jgi:hypothetical protein
VVPGKLLGSAIAADNYIFCIFRLPGPARTARFTAHSAFEDPTAPANVLPRESIEVRTLVFHNA